jgi:hypothetical protein
MRLMINSEIELSKILKSPLIVTNLSNEYDILKNTTLYDLFHSNNIEIEREDYFKLTVFTIGILPANVREIT